MDKRKMIAVSEDTHTKIKIAAAQRKMSVKDYLDMVVTGYEKHFTGYKCIDKEENES